MKLSTVYAKCIFTTHTLCIGISHGFLQCFSHLLVPPIAGIVESSTPTAVGGVHLTCVVSIFISNSMQKKKIYKGNMLNTLKYSFNVSPSPMFIPYAIHWVCLRLDDNQFQAVATITTNSTLWCVYAYIYIYMVEPDKSMHCDVPVCNQLKLTAQRLCPLSLFSLCLVFSDASNYKLYQIEIM